MFSFLLINLSAVASTTSGMQQHDTGMILDISTAAHRPALKSMSFVNFIYSLISKGTYSSIGSKAFCLYTQEGGFASTYTLLKPQAYLYNHITAMNLTHILPFLMSFKA